MPRINKRLIYFAIAILLLLFLVFEFSVRTSWSIPGRSYPSGMHIPDEDAGYLLTPGFEGEFPNGVPVRINSKGLRDNEYSYEKPGDKFRILVIGDTITFGPGISHEDLFSEILERRLNENYNVEVINAAVNGHEIESVKAVYISEGVKYNPDLVIYSAALNDILRTDFENIKNNFAEFNDSTGSPPDTPLEAAVKEVCNSCVFTYSITRGIILDEGVGDEGYNEYIFELWRTEEYHENFKENFFEIAESLGDAEFVVIVYPYDTQLSGTEENSPQEILKEIAEEANATFIDASGSFEEDHYLEKSGGRVINEKGHEAAADILYNYIREKYLFK